MENRLCKGNVPYEVYQPKAFRNLRTVFGGCKAPPRVLLRNKSNTCGCLRSRVKFKPQKIRFYISDV